MVYNYFGKEYQKTVNKRGGLTPPQTKDGSRGVVAASNRIKIQGFQNKGL